jgi:hypothetical protein
LTTARCIRLSSAKFYPIIELCRQKVKKNVILIRQKLNGRAKGGGGGRTIAWPLNTPLVEIELFEYQWKVYNSFISLSIFILNIAGDFKKF